MVSLTCTTSRAEGVTLVTGQLENSASPRRVRVENQLDGPLWPPRRRGVPAPGWENGGFECVLTAGETRALGYASPEPPVDPPLVVVETEPVDSDTVDSTAESQTAVPSVEGTPTGVIRALGSPQPPRDAVPMPGSTGETATDTETDPAASEPTDTENSSPETTATGTQSTPVDTASGEPTDPGRTDSPSKETPVAAVDTWFETVDARIDIAERLSGNPRLPVAADALEAAGGLAGVRAIEDQLDADTDELRRIARRADSLADRAEAAEIPVDQIERLQ